MRPVLVGGRRYRIGEVAKFLGVNRVTLRFWEEEFALRPLRSKSGQRIYTEAMIERLGRIKELLYVKRFTIEGARIALKTSSGGEPARAIQTGSRGQLWIVMTPTGLEMHGMDDGGVYHSPSRQVYEQHILPAFRELEALRVRLNELQAEPK
jgi:DNA-binding transcriptional MerR regulator